MGELGGRSGIRLPLGLVVAVLIVVFAFQDQVLGDVETWMGELLQKRVGDGEGKRHDPAGEKKNGALSVSVEHVMKE